MFVRRYTEHEARAAIAASASWAEALRRLGRRAAGGNHAVLRRRAAAWNIDTSHFRPYARAGAHLRRPAVPLAEVLVAGSSYSRGSLKRRLYEEGLKERRCEHCGQEEMWRGRPMALVLDHINGVHDDNRLENLQIVCPNCAATLDTHCARNQPANRCRQCGASFKRRGPRHRYCSQRCWHASDEWAAARGGMRRVERPSHEQLLRDLETLSYLAVGRKYGVSDNAVRKWLRRYEAGQAG